MSVVWQETLIHTKIYFRDRQAVFWGFLFPVLLLILFCSVFGGTPERSTSLVAGLICINTMSGALFGTSVIIVSARELGILRRYKVAPVKLYKIVTGLCVSRLLSITLTILLMMVLARLLYHILLPEKILTLIVVYGVGTVMFCAISFAVAGLSRSVSQANGIAQILFMPMMFLSGATLPYEFMPGWLQKIGYALPSTHYVAALKSIMIANAGLTENLTALVFMSVFTLFSIALAIKFFQWE